MIIITEASGDDYFHTHSTLCQTVREKMTTEKG
jgi:hypothetical protein